MMNKPKYSIIIPVNNVINYLPATIESIISQNYTDYELIISDDNSTDGTAEYIDSLNHPNIKVLHTISRLTMAAHFDWAQTHASGQWQMFVGGDDGLQPYFFQLADMLTEIAAKKNIRTIASRRAYFFWNGCQSDYGDVAVSYSVTKSIELNLQKEMYRCLYSKDDYFNLPQMYTTSLFHKTLIDQMRQMQNAKFLTYGISDANMAAISVSMEKDFYIRKYLLVGLEHLLKFLEGLMILSKILNCILAVEITDWALCQYILGLY
ncbi:glycosyltransferase family 2 protein [Treponema sp. OMZ 792]|uniref:glycosyltransferase family 2 protein n=1 Tax=Treponema sp. OMZ 792 TaxID=2563667 RepID=UPI0020A3956D|nr:glycosyltransferase family 2 protein [Treponema sp. OMZ 792]UTC76304.1 glycosyltransferase family 2 protein [Treponema sp. OMZ 792]